MFHAVMHPSLILVTALLPLVTARNMNSEEQLTKPSQYAQNIPVFTEKPIPRDTLLYKKQKSDQQLNYAVTNPVLKADDRLVRDKLVSLLLSSKRDVAERMFRIDSIHEVYKSEKMYQIGYLVSYINKLYKRLSEMYEAIERNKYNWKVLKILNAYKESKSERPKLCLHVHILSKNWNTSAKYVTSSKDFLSEILRVLHGVVSNDHKQLLEDLQVRKSIDQFEDKHTGLIPNFIRNSQAHIPRSGVISWSCCDEALGN